MIKKKILLRWLALIFLLLVSLHRIGLILEVWGSPENEVDRRSTLFFYLPKNSVDVLFLGNSHVYCSYIPKQMFDEEGISSAELSTSAQSLQNSYYLLKEALKKQTPKVVVLDYSTIATSVDDRVKNFRLHFTSGISIIPDSSINKYLEFIDIKRMNYGYSNNVSLEDVIAFLEYRNEYNRENCNLNSFANLLFNPVKEYYTLGYYPTNELCPLDSISPGIQSKENVPLEDTVEFKYFTKINDLCQENNIQLLMVRSVYDSPDYDDCNLTNQFKQYMSDNQITYIDFFDIYKNLGIDLQKDFRDEDHLNYRGAQKTTSYLEDFLKSHYDLQDHRGDKKYDLWENNDFDYSKYL